MSDLENFCQMLDHARLPYITQTSKWVGCESHLLPKHVPARASDQNVTASRVSRYYELEDCVCVAVEGNFYEELHAWFDKEGALVTMESHVCIGHRTGRTKELAKLVRESYQ